MAHYTLDGGHIHKRITKDSHTSPHVPPRVPESPPLPHGLQPCVTITITVGRGATPQTKVRFIFNSFYFRSILA